MTKTRFKAEIDGQVLRRASVNHFYTHMVAVRKTETSCWTGLNWCRDEKLAQKKERAAKRAGYFKTLILETQVDTPTPGNQARHEAAEAVKAPSATCRLCGRDLESDAARARGYGDKCWRKARAAAIAGEEIEGTKKDTWPAFPDPYHITDPTQAAAARIAARMLIEDLKCPSCDEGLSCANLDSYDHPDGYRVTGYDAPQWFYATCQVCQHQCSLWKLRVTEEDLQVKAAEIYDATVRYDAQVDRYRPGNQDHDPADFPELTKIVDDLAPEFETEALKKSLGLQAPNISALIDIIAVTGFDYAHPVAEIPRIRAELENRGISADGLEDVLGKALLETVPDPSAQEPDPDDVGVCPTCRSEIRFKAAVFEENDDGFTLDDSEAVKTAPIDRIWIVQICPKCGEIGRFPGTDEAADLANEAFKQWQARQKGEEK